MREEGEKLRKKLLAHAVASMSNPTGGSSQWLHRAWALFLVMAVWVIPAPVLSSESHAAQGIDGTSINVSSFNPNEGSLLAIGFDPVSDNLFLYPQSGPEIFEYSTSGSRIGAIPVPGSTTRGIGLDFALEPLTVGGQVVSQNTLLVANGESSPSTLFAVDKNDGSIDAQQATPSSSLNGGTHDMNRDTFLTTYHIEDTIREFDPGDGSMRSTVPVAPSGAPAFDVYNGDVDVDPDSGNILLVSSSQNLIRRLSPTGEWLGDVDLFDESTGTADPENVHSMSGIAIDGDTRDVYVSGTNGSVWKITGLFEAFESFDQPSQCQDPEAICGGSEDEELEGTPEDEFIFGGGGNDEIDGGGGNDIIVGGNGNDVIIGGPGKDKITGGSGKDRIVGDSERGSSASPARTGARSYQEAPAADQLAGGGGNDSVFGGGGADQVAGGSGEDKILGESGNDKLKGDAGNDLLKGGGGVNNFDGGPGKDKCVLENRKDKTESCEKKARSFARSFWPTRLPRRRI